VNTLDLLLRHLDALYVYDARGRIVRCNQPELSAPAAPRFHFASSPVGNLWRMRADLEPELVRRLAELAGREALAGSRGESPERGEFLRRALEAGGEIVEQYAGPAFAFEGPPPALPATDARIEALTRADAPRLHPDLVSCADDLATSGPCVGAVVSGVVVSLCRTERGTPELAAEAGLVTVREARGRGYAVAVSAEWARCVRARGGLALYSTPWDNAASRAVAARLGLLRYGEDWHLR
jgi:hypothetical protein